MGLVCKGLVGGERYTGSVRGVSKMGGASKFTDEQRLEIADLAGVSRRGEMGKHSWSS